MIVVCSGGENDKPMQHPWTFVISLEADSNIIPSIAYTNDIASNRVHKVISWIPCTSNNSKIMLNPGIKCQLIKFIVTQDIS